MKKINSLGIALVTSSLVFNLYFPIKNFVNTHLGWKDFNFLHLALLQFAIILLTVVLCELLISNRSPQKLRDKIK